MAYVVTNDPWSSQYSVGIGTDAPNRKLEVYGTNAVNTAAGPHTWWRTAADAYPQMSIYAYGHDNMALMFDNYIHTDGNVKSSDAGSNFDLSKRLDKFRIRYGAGTAAGSTVTMNDGIVLDTSGNVGIGTLSPASAVGFTPCLEIRGEPSLRFEESKC